MLTDLDLTPLPFGDDDVEVLVLDVTRLPTLEPLAQGMLTLEEHAEYARLRHPERRREWLAARVCLKTMLLRRRWISDPRECAIVKDARGRPRLAFGVERPAETAYDCSLSHKGRLACAGAARTPEIRVGVDVEEVSPRLVRLAGAFAHDRDVLLGGRSDAERLAILWALKEACAKVLGSGLDARFRDAICCETARGRHRVTTAGGLELRGRHVVHQGYVIAVCVAGAHAPPPRA
jgi:phosphopantetheinyl transferase